MEIMEQPPFNSKEKSNGTQGPTVTSFSLETLMEISDSVSPCGSKFAPEKNNHDLMLIEVTKVVASINSTLNFVY